MAKKKKKNPLDQVDDIIAVGMDTHTTSIREKMVAMYRKMLKEGMHNGAQGIIVEEGMVNKRAGKQAETCQEELATLINQRLGQLEEEKNAANIQHSHSSEDLQTMYYDLGYLNLARNHSSDSQGKLSLWTCMILGIFLIIADISLAVQLVQLGFSLPEPTIKEYQIPNLVSAYFFKVLQHNWQVFLTAFGIAVFTIVLKIGFDRFIGASYGAGFIRRVRFTRWFKDQKETDEAVMDDMLRRIRRFEKVKNWVVLIFVGLTIVFLVYLAQFRSMAQEKARVMVENKQYMQELHNQKGKVPDSVYKAEIIITNQKIKDNTSKQEAKAAPLYAITFFGITLLFPVISAICLSIAGTAREVRRKTRQLLEEIETGKKVLEKDHRQYGKARGELKAWELEKEYIEKPDWKARVTEKLADLYNYGFRIGNIRPDLFQDIPDMYNIIERYRDKRILYLTNQALIKLNKPKDEDTQI